MDLDLFLQLCTRYLEKTFLLNLFISMDQTQFYSSMTLLLSKIFLYVTYNKYFDKGGRSKKQLQDLFGDGIVLIESNELWREKRKHLSAAFYKEKMIAMLDSISELAFDRVSEWKRDYAGQDREFALIRSPADLLMDCIQACVFGQKHLGKKLSYIQDGVEKELTVGQFMKDITTRLFFRSVGILRSLTTMFDASYVTKDEKEIQRNLLCLRAYIKDLIRDKKEEMRQEKTMKEDFLSIMLQDELYRDDLERMVDECVTFMFAASQTTGIMVTETLFRFIQNRDILQKVKKELCEVLKRNDFQKMTK